jgi:hypothetical protein
MSAISKKLRSMEGDQLGFWCPGCEMMHAVSVGQGPGPRWGYNGNPEAPTFTPSILVRTGHFVEPNGKHCDKSGDPEWPCDCVCCHSFVTDGRIQFLGDCTHALAGQTVELPDRWPEGWGE